MTYNNNPNLPSEFETHEFTPEEISEYVKCMNDPVYFTRTYVKIIHMDKGVVAFEPYEYQENIIRAIYDERFVIAKLPRQSGKCLVSDTNITIRNKKTGEIKIVTMAEFHEIQNKKKK